MQIILGSVNNRNCMFVSLISKAYICGIGIVLRQKTVINKNNKEKLQSCL